MSAQKILKTLHPLERKILPAVEDKILLSELIKKTGLKDVEVMRAVQWLEVKEVIKTEDDNTETYELTPKGKDAKENGLPEIRFLKSLETGKDSCKTL
jgi:predicted transcriptional regulator